MAPASQMHDITSASLEEKQPGFWASDYSVDHFLALNEKCIFPHLTGVKRAAPVRCLSQHCPTRLELSLSAFAKTSHKTEMQRYRVERNEREVLCKSGILPLVIKGSMDFTPAIAAFHLQGEIRKRRTIHNIIHSGKYTIHLPKTLKV